MIHLESDDSFVTTPPVTFKCAQRLCGSDVGKKYSFAWNATRQMLEGLSKNAPIKSPPFRLGPKEEIEACLVIHPSSFVYHNDAIFACECIALFLQIDPKYHESIRGNLTLKILGYFKKEIAISKDTIKPGCGWGFDRINFVFAQDVILKITCTVILAENMVARPTTPEMTALKFLKKLCMSQNYSDVTIVVGEIHLKAHKLILATQSPVFEAMFLSEFEEAKTNVVNIVDMDVDVVKEMLRYMYTERMEDLQGTAERLLVAADKYCLSDLKTMCEDALVSTVAVQNVSRLLRLSDLHRAQRLKVKCAEFIRCHMDQVQVTDGWKMLKNTSAELIVECFVEQH